MFDSTGAPAPTPLPIAVVTTVATRAEARAMATALVSRRLAACVQISEIESVYSWQDTLHDEAEFRLVVKTIAASYAAVEAAIRELHPYELPAIYAVAFANVDGAYADWIADGSSGR